MDVLKSLERLKMPKVTYTCVDCKHFEIWFGNDDYYGEGGCSGRVSCAKSLFKSIGEQDSLSDNADLKAFRKAIKTAETCKEYEHA